MKWLFATLLGLNIIVFAGMIAGKMWKEYKPAAAQVNNTPQQPTQIVIYTNDLQNSASGVAGRVVNGGNNALANANGAKPPVTVKPPVAPTATTPAKPKESGKIADAAPVAQPQASYKNCSARVSMPEDDYHRIKGLLGKYPHAASRQVVDGGGEGGAQTSSRMNVLFMSVSDQDAGAIQAVVGRYGQLNRAPCNK